jgi:uncharacterized membrane protein YgcG
VKQQKAKSQVKVQVGKKVESQTPAQKKPLKYIFALIAASLLAAVTIFSGNATAQVTPGGWEIDAFHADYVLNGRGGSMLIKERIDVTFQTPKHGILRQIPNKYNTAVFSPDTDLMVSVQSVLDETGKPYPYTEYYENNNKILKIGDPDKTITGAYQYNIEYTVQNAIRFFSSHDELFWDINGTESGVAHGKVSARFIIDEELLDNYTDIKCYTGIYGLSGDDCSIEINEDREVIANSSRVFSPFENLSVVIGFERDTFIRPSWWEQYSSVIMRHAGIVLIPVPILVIMYVIWDRRGRDIKSRKVVVVQFDPPNGLTPAEVGTLSDYTVDNKDVTSTIIDLAIRGYLKLIDTTKRDSSKNRKYTIELMKDDLSELSEHEKLLLNGLFSQIKKGRKVEVKALKNEFYQTIDKIKNQLYEHMTEHQYFSANPHTAKTGFMVFGSVLIVLGLITIGPTEARVLGWSLGLSIAGCIFAFFGLIMPKRTLKGYEAMEHIRGLKKYMEVAEEDRIAMMQSPDSQYIGDVMAEEFTVELYEKLLPYALVLGVEKEWGDKFKDIYTQPPDWYQGNWSTFNAYMLSSRLSGGLSSMNTTLASRPSSSGGSSGFSSGGGFSGGGFGGGGTGAW